MKTTGDHDSAHLILLVAFGSLSADFGLVSDIYLTEKDVWFNRFLDFITHLLFVFCPTFKNDFTVTQRKPSAGYGHIWRALDYNSHRVRWRLWSSRWNDYSSDNRGNIGLEQFRSILAENPRHESMLVHIYWTWREIDIHSLVHLISDRLCIV